MKAQKGNRLLEESSLLSIQLGQPCGPGGLLTPLGFAGGGGAAG
jgi:hypothetical protein